MSKTRWIIFAVVCVLVLAGLVFLVNRNRVNVSDVDANTIIAASEGSLGDNVYGNKDAKVILFEYGDFQCPSCGGAYSQIKAVKEQYKDKIAFVFRNLPLTSIHPNALAAASAAEAAGRQGKFWEMHDQLYENQNSWSNASTDQRGSIFEQYAAAIGLDMARYQTDLTSKEVTEKIARDRGLANKLKLSATPSILINGEKMDDETVQDLVQGDGAKLKAKLDTQLKAAGVEPPKATTEE